KASIGGSVIFMLYKVAFFLFIEGSDRIKFVFGAGLEVVGKRRIGGNSINDYVSSGCYRIVPRSGCFAERKHPLVGL
ncbi:MAG: hypothetical protein K8F24_03800, partial [Bacteroidales bacterium]|nr:hypothetical protein [Bacteroidales bacterium]